MRWGANENGAVLRSQLVAEFQSTLGKLPLSNAFKLPDLTSYVDHEARLTRPDMHTLPGIYLQEQPSITAGAQSEGFTFLSQPGRRLGREMSHNYVFFGKLLIHSTDWRPEAEQGVAIKPSKDIPALLGELAMFQYLHKLHIPTFAPSGLVIAPPQHNSHLLTRFDMRVATMDTVEWAELDMDERWAQLGLVINTLTLLHGQLLFHNDIEFRNVAFGERGETIVVDPELMVSARGLIEAAEHYEDTPEGQRARLVIKQRMSRDFTDVCNSIDEFIINPMMPRQHRSDAAKFKDYNRRLFRPYREALLDCGSPHVPLLLDTLATVVSEHKQRARRETSRIP